VGEINADLRRMVLTQFGDSTPFTVHSDDAPTVYVTGADPLSPASQTSAVVRNLEREMAQLSWLNPYTGVVENNIMVALADHTAMKTLHMITADPFRTPTFTPFADPDWFLFATGGPACATPDACASIPARTNQSFAWNHGDVQEEIATTWVGYVGQGVQRSGINQEIWSDHTDVRPTILQLVGLKDDYVQDGRVVSEILRDDAKSSAVKKSPLYVALARTYKQLNAPFGAFAKATLRASTKALASNDAGDATYTDIEGRIQDLTSRRDALAAQMKEALNGAAFRGQPIGNLKATVLIARGIGLLAQANALPH
jgi:hypothetical protein